MRVFPLKKNPQLYTCAVYLVLGDWNRLEDVNTLIDVGTDGFILKELEGFATGVGKRRVERVVMTHSHFDHVGGLAEIQARYHSEAWSFSPFSPMVRQLQVDAQADRTFIPTVRKLQDGMIMRIGDRDFTVMHTPGHSTDSICLYCPGEQVLFSGDTPLNIMTPGGVLLDGVRALARKACLLACPSRRSIQGMTTPSPRGRSR